MVVGVVRRDRADTFLQIEAFGGNDERHVAQEFWSAA
jgi:hypothetical protein